MGLAMVYGTAQRHGAEISIESAPGRGTSVTIAFPCDGCPPGAPQVPAAPQDVRAPAPAPSRALRLLLVDDDPLVLETLRHMLQASGHAVTAAAGGRVGIDTFRDALGRGEPFDVVVTDLGMPDVDGRAVARAIKRLSSATPVILLTGWGEGLHRSGGGGQHIDAVLGKPPRRNDLDEALAHLTQPTEPVVAVPGRR